MRSLNVRTRNSIRTLQSSFSSARKGSHLTRVLRRLLRVNMEQLLLRLSPPIRPTVLSAGHESSAGAWEGHAHGKGIFAAESQLLGGNIW